MSKSKILIISNFESRNRSLFAKYAQAHHEVTVTGVRSFFVAWDGKSVRIQDPSSKKGFGSFDAYYLAGWRVDTQLGLVMAQWLKRHNKPFIGNTSLGVYPTSKLGEMTYLVGAGVPYPKTFYASRPEDIEKLYKWSHKGFGLKFPIIVKAIHAMMGKDNFLVHNQKEQSSLRLNAKKNYIIQESIPNNCDYRVIIIGGKIQLVMKRSRIGNKVHVNNTSKGAKAEFIELRDFPKSAQAMALKAAKALSRIDVSGVDIVINKETGLAYVLENRTPAIAMGVSEDIDIARKLKALYASFDDLISKARK